MKIKYIREKGRLYKTNPGGQSANRTPPPLKAQLIHKHNNFWIDTQFKLVLA